MKLINGIETDQISAEDRGLLYGDGLFETIAVLGGEMPLWDRHMQRLVRGCRQLAIPPPDTDTLRSEAHRLLDGKDSAVVKIIVTRGAGQRGYAPGVAQSPTRIVAAYPPPEYPASLAREGVKVRVCVTRLGAGPALAGVKHLNRLEQVLARSEWQDSDTREGLMLDQAGNVIAGTMTNLFYVSEGQLLTPPLTDCGVAGVMRGYLMDVANGSGFDVAERTCSLASLSGATELFLCNSVAGIWPIRELDGRMFIPGEITKSLQAPLRELGFVS